MKSMQHFFEQFEFPCIELCEIFYPCATSIIFLILLVIMISPFLKE